MKKAIIIVSYQEEKELNTFLSKNGTHLEVSAVYEDLDDANMEQIQKAIHVELMEEK